jgi:hypothetical protein
MLYTLIITVIMTSGYQKAPSVSHAVVPGFTTEKACKNAGEVARKGMPRSTNAYQSYVSTIYQCAPNNL